MYSIRKALPDDAENILRYCKVVGSETDNLTFGAEGVGLSTENEKQYLEKIYHSDSDIYLVAVENDDICGVCCLSGYKRERLSHRAEVSISVKKSMWGQHIGTELLRTCLETAKKTNRIQIVSLEVRADNVAAISLYKKFGFETVGTFKGFMKIHGQYIDCCIMELFL